MNEFRAAVRRKFNDGVVLCKYVALPDDRPSPLFGMFNVFMNGGLLIWSFAVILSSTCATFSTRWVAIGITHSFINMIFGVVMMMATRIKIENGILADASIFQLFLMDPFMIAYMAYLVWEISWMAIAGQVAIEANRLGVDPCYNHFHVQIAFYVIYLLIAVPLFIFTFMTEGGRMPRWRARADIRWYLHNQPETLMRRAAEITQSTRTTSSLNHGVALHEAERSLGWDTSTLDETFIEAGNQRETSSYPLSQAALSSTFGSPEKSATKSKGPPVSQYLDPQQLQAPHIRRDRPQPSPHQAGIHQSHPVSRQNTSLTGESSGPAYANNNASRSDYPLPDVKET